MQKLFRLQKLSIKQCLNACKVVLTLPILSPLPGPPGYLVSYPLPSAWPSLLSCILPPPFCLALPTLLYPTVFPLPGPPYSPVSYFILTNYV